LEEDEAATRRQEAETAAAGTVLLDGATIEVKRNREAVVKLTCSDVKACTGELTLTASAGKGKRRHAKTESIGTAGFSIAPGGRTTVKVPLDKTGRALLAAARGHLSAALTIARTAPLPTGTQTQRVRLVQQKAVKAKGGR
jgi:hypothetical protein